MRFKNQNEIDEIIRTFENGTIGRSAWKHPEHLTVALYYLTRHDMETATEKMRGGILNLLRAFEVDLTKEMPYHETLTIFWMQTIADFRIAKTGVPLMKIANEMIATFDKDYPMKFYSHDVLFSDEARSKYVEADLK